MKDEKIYHPQEIQDQPFPQEEVVTVGTTQKPSGDTFSPTTIKEKPLPKKVIAHETIGSALNTLSRKILGTFEFIQQGAIQIGKYINGVSGDIRLTPNGITARDKAGNTTFNLDGDTGNAVFKGEVQAEDFVVVDEKGLVSLANFDSDSDTFTGDQSFTDTSYTDISGLSLTFTLDRSTKVLIILTVQSAQEQTNDTLDMGGRVHYAIEVDGTQQTPEIINDAAYVDANGDGDGVKRSTFSIAMIKTLTAGEKTLTASYKISGATNMTAHLYVADLIYVILGR